jgi:hypothetical protein
MLHQELQQNPQPARASQPDNAADPRATDTSGKNRCAN